MQYNILNNYLANIQVTENPYEFEPEHLFKMALRINKKRRFLFVSEVLGKHLAVQPQMPILISYLLTHRYLEVARGKKHPNTDELVTAIKEGRNLQATLKKLRDRPFLVTKSMRVIGFAETATALGHAFFENLWGDVEFVHTTREKLVDHEPLVSFEEEHSHASTHRLYCQESFFEGDVEVVLVDDEMSTGNTNINIIRQLNKRFPHIKHYNLVAILDWRNEQQVEAFTQLEKELDISILTISIMRGEFTIDTIDANYPSHQVVSVVPQSLIHYFTCETMLKTLCLPAKSENAHGELNEANYLNASGRFSITPQVQSAYTDKLNLIVEQLSLSRTGGKCLIIGTGEFMYIPMHIAAQLDGEVYYQSTTRSPILANEDSIIWEQLKFYSPEYPGIVNYLYNIPEDLYQDIIVIFERVLDEEALGELAALLAHKTMNLQIYSLGGGQFAQIQTGSNW